MPCRAASSTARLDGAPTATRTPADCGLLHELEREAVADAEERRVRPFAALVRCDPGQASRVPRYVVDIEFGGRLSDAPG
jgi:hypothetical protein